MFAQGTLPQRLVARAAATVRPAPTTVTAAADAVELPAAPSRPGLFLPSPPERLPVWLALVGVVAAVVASLFREGGVPAWNTIWAEDGTDSLRGVVDNGFWQTVTTPVAGYYQTLPRLLAEPVVLMPATWAAPLFAFEAATVTALFALFVYVASAAHLRTPLARLAAAAVAVVVPVDMGDVPNSLCNLHWAGMYAVLWALLYVPRGRLGKGVSLAVVVLVALTNILVVVFLPLAVFRALSRRGDLDGPDGVGPRRDRYGIVLAAAMAVALVPQVINAVAGGADNRVNKPHPAPVGAFEHFFQWVGPRAFLGEVLVSPARMGAVGSWLIPLAVWGAVAAAVLVGLRYTAPRWAAAAVLAAHALVLWMVAAGGTGLFLDRYETTPTMLLVAAVVAVLVPGARTGPLTAFALVLAVVWAVNYREPTLRSEGPRWTVAVAEARARCTQTGAATTVIGVSPIAQPPWNVTLSCHYLLQYQNLRHRLLGWLH